MISDKYQIIKRLKESKNKTIFTMHTYADNISKIANVTANGFANETANKIDVAGSFSDVSV